LPYKNKELGRILKREYSRTRRLQPEVRERINKAQRERYAERKKRVEERFGKNRPGAKELDKERNLQLRVAKIFSGEYVAEKETQEHRERRERHNAYMRAYRANPEVRERNRQYYITRNKTPKRKLQRHKSYLKYRDRNIAIARDYRKRPDIKERSSEYEKLRNQSAERKLQRRILPHEKGSIERLQRLGEDCKSMTEYAIKALKGRYRNLSIIDDIGSSLE
jgi:hypothetical protein